jgi:Flp pilus assembly protein TadD
VLAFVLMLAGLTFAQAGRWRDSRALWGQALAVNHDSALAAGNLGNVLLESGDVGGAIESLKRAVAIDPNDAFANLNLARALLVSGDTAGAAQSALDTVAAYRRRADFNPELSAALLERFAEQINHRGDAASARRLMDESRRLVPTTLP